MPRLNLKSKNLKSGRIDFTIHSDGRIDYTADAKIKIGFFSKKLDRSGTLELDRKAIQSSSYQDVGDFLTVEGARLTVTDIFKIEGNSRCKVSIAHGDFSGIALLDISKELIKILQFRVFTRYCGKDYEVIAK